MPELPEVHTTATILHRLIVGKKISDVWSDYNSPYYKGKSNIKDTSYFKKFAKEILGKKILGVYRRAKNVLIDLEGDQTILVHMKMTGQLLYGKYSYHKKLSSWRPVDPESPLNDPMSRFVHLVFTLSDNHHIAFSDMRKFATVSLIKNKQALQKVFGKLGPEPLEENFNLDLFTNCLQRKPKGKVKTVLMDTSIVAGIGNIYSDEILWTAGIHPETIVSRLNAKNFKDLLKATKKLLSKGIDFGGDSMSDYRNPYGLKGEFQLHHEAYRRTNLPCRKKGCKGIITRKVVGGRSAHFCNIHQENKTSLK